MQIIPAILTNEIQKAREQLNVLRGISPWIQIDVMDGKFVPNTSFSLFDLIQEDLNTYSSEVHLMVINPEKYFDICSQLKVNRVIVHYEAVPDLGQILEVMMRYNFKISIALNPDTPADVLTKYLGVIDAVLVMSVIPGFQGQSFISSVLSKASFLKKQKPDLIVGIDGGINFSTLLQISGTHFDYAGIGSTIFSSPDPRKSYNDLQNMGIII